MAETSELGHLLHAATKALRNTWTQELAPYDITPHQWRCLRILQHHDGGVRAKDLADRLHIAPRSVTEVVDQLEAKGILTRQPDPTDRRAVRIELTPGGRELSDAVHAVRRERSGQFFSTLGEDEQDELARLLSKLTSTD